MAHPVLDLGADGSLCRDLFTVLGKAYPLQQGSIYYVGYSMSRLLLLLSSPEPFSHPLIRTCQV